MKVLVGIIRKKGRKEHTNRPLPLRVVLFRNVVCALIFEIRCRNLSVRGRRTLPVGLTFTGNREENQATRFANVGCHQILHEIDIRGVSTLANACDQSFSNAFSSTVEQKRVERDKIYLVDHRTIDLSTPAH